MAPIVLIDEGWLLDIAQTYVVRPAGTGGRGTIAAAGSPLWFPSRARQFPGIEMTRCCHHHLM